MTAGGIVKAGGRAKKTSVALLAASMVLAACGGAKPDSSASRTTGSPPTATATAPTTSASPTATADPNIPAAARAHTPAGAEAFVRYFYAQLNLAWSKPQAGLISGLSSPTCKTCSNFEEEAAKSVAKNERVVGQSIVLDTVGTSDASNPAKMTVLAIGYQPKTIVVDSSGKTVQTLQRESVRTLVTVQWHDVGWRLGEIQSVR
jgi:predicted lipid-binding transport protein (Tim44 family)